MLLLKPLFKFSSFGEQKKSEIPICVAKIVKSLWVIGTEKWNWVMIVLVGYPGSALTLTTNGFG